MGAPGVREQVSRYWGRYGLVLVTNLREFTLVGPDASGGEVILESFRLADSEEAFARKLETPQTSRSTSLAPASASISPVHCRTVRPLPSRKTWLGC